MPQMHRYADNIQVSKCFNTAITAAANTGTGVDTLHFRRAAAVFYSIPSGSGTTSDCKLQESDDDVDGHYADVASATFTQATTVGAAQLQVMNIDLAKRKRWLRLIHTGVGASAAGVATGVFHLYQAETLAIGLSNLPAPVSI